jgi:hypothetical protein
MGDHLLKRRNDWPHMLFQQTPTVEAEFLPYPEAANGTNQIMFIGTLVMLMYMLNIFEKLNKATIQLALQINSSGNN